MKKKTAVMITLTIAIFISSMANITNADQPSTEIHLAPQTQTISPGESFTVDIYVEPAQPVKAVEFKLSFNPSLLLANEVTEGDLFTGYTTFFNSGTIDNTNGDITKVSGLIVGQGNVTDPGIFVTISFTAKQTTGSSSLDLYEVGATNETTYVNIIVYDGTVVVEDSTFPLVNNSQSTPPDTPSIPSGSITGLTSTVYYYSTATEDPDDDQVYYWFDWGDHTDSGWIGPYPSGGTASSSKTWNTPGTYTIKAKAKDEHGNESNWSIPLTVTITNQNTGQDTGSDNQGENMPPIAQFTYLPIMATTQDTLQFTDHSTDLNGTIASWYWDFGDNTNSTSQNPTHAYEDNEAYTVALTIWDDSGATNTTIQHIIVANTPPAAKFTYTPTFPLQNDTVQFTDQSTDLDGTIISWQWDFGDGIHSMEKNTHHQYNTNGTFTITLYVTDDDNATDSAKKTITVREKPNDEKITDVNGETSDFTFVLAIILVLIIIIIGNLFYLIYYKPKRIKKKKKEIVTKIKDKKINKIALCPKCKTRVPVNGTKGQKLKVICPSCGAGGIVKI